MPVLRRKEVVGQSAEVTRKAFIQPDVLPASTSDLVAEPLVREFVRGKFITETAHERDRLVFHAAAPAELAMAVLLICERIKAEQIAEERHLLLDIAGVQLHLESVLRIGPCFHRDRVVGHFDLRVVHFVIRYRECDQVMRDRVAVSPMKTFQAASEINFFDQETVACRAIGRRCGDPYVDRIGLVLQVLFAGPPIHCAVRFGKRPDHRGAFVIALHERTESAFRRDPAVFDRDRGKGAIKQVDRNDQLIAGMCE